MLDETTRRRPRWGLCANGKAPTVAQHTVEGAEWAYASTLALRGADDAWTATRHFIVHDWAEAYLGDVRAPLKALPEFAPLRALEKRIDAVIRKRMDLAVVVPDWVDAVVAMADKEDARREQRWLLPAHSCWGGLSDVRGMPKFAWSSEMAKSRLVQLVEKFWGAEVWR